MDRIARFLVHRSKLVLAVTGILTIVAAGMFFRIRLNADVTQFLTSGNPKGEAWVALQDKYDTSDPINVLVTLPEGQTFTDKEALVALVELRDRLAAVDGVASVGSILPDTNPLTGQAITADTIRALPDVAIGQFLASNPLADLLVNGRNTLMVVAPPASTSPSPATR